ncbi:hypothetical protein Bca4012_090745 [Brassica carinata]|uniref:Uncharacterized protein n=1 Tax=Brassica carinata TaxID=52824 RepID=A0A8X7P8M5_BRACI|nr:hypothetical protein Bca52824_085901 [Brassica carinata]
MTVRCSFEMTNINSSHKTVGTSHKAEGVDIALEHIHNIREALPELWDSVDDKAQEIRVRQKVAIETIA